MKKSRKLNKRGKKPFTQIAVAVFAVVAIVHVFRLLSNWYVVVGGVSIPNWVSVLGLIVSGGLALMVWREMDNK